MSYDKAKENARRRELDVRFVYSYDGHECTATREGDTCMDCEDSALRVRIVPDDCCDWDSLKGDCFNPAVNTDIDPDVLAEEERAFERHVSRFGVWGVIAEYKDDAGRWCHAESVWGICDDDGLALCMAEFKENLMENATPTPESWLAL